MMGDWGMRLESGLPNSTPIPTLSLLPFYLKGSVSSRTTNPKEAYMRTSCSRRRVRCWEISNSCKEGA